MSIIGRSRSMELLTPYINDIENIDGVISWQLELSGLYKDPIKTGQIIFDNVNIDLLQLDNKISKINGIGKVNNNFLWFYNVSATLNKKNMKGLVSDQIFSISNLFTSSNNDDIKFSVSILSMLAL